jgi:hypothetical protein
MEKLISPSQFARMHNLSRQRINTLIKNKDSRIAVKVIDGRKYVSSESIFSPYGKVSYNKGKR